MDNIVDVERPSYPTHQWGALAADPWMEIASPAAGLAFHCPALRAWLADGGSAEVFVALCEPRAIGQ